MSETIGLFKKLGPCNSVYCIDTVWSGSGTWLCCSLFSEGEVFTDVAGYFSVAVTVCNKTSNYNG